MSEKIIQCPTCGVGFQESIWNKNTQEIVSGLNDSHEPITPYSQRAEGTAYRCPNAVCEDEVITDENGVLRTQDGEGMSIIV